MCQQQTHLVCSANAIASDSTQIIGTFCKVTSIWGVRNGICYSSRAM